MGLILHSANGNSQYAAQPMQSSGYMSGNNMSNYNGNQYNAYMQRAPIYGGMLIIWNSFALLHFTPSFFFSKEPNVLIRKL